MTTRPLPQPARPPTDPNAAALTDTLVALTQEAYQCHRDGRLADAVSRYQRVLALRPGMASIHNNLGNAVAELGRKDEALLEYRQAVELAPDYVEAWCNWGIALNDLRRSDEAEEKYRRALALDGNYAEAHYSLSVLMKQKGQFDEATRGVERAIELAPNRPMYFDHLASLRPFTIGDRYFLALERMGRDSAAGGVAPFAAKEQIHRHLALYRVYDHAGDADAAFQHLAAANRLKRLQVVYDEADALGMMDRARALLTAELLDSRRGAGDPSQLPIFIIGMPRSGTSLIEQILASHPDVFGAGELDFLDRFTGEVSKALPGAPPYPQFVLDMPPNYIRGLGVSYLREVSQLAPTAKRVVDKMPANFYFAGLIHLALPNATIIHALRDPVDTCVSCFAASFTNQVQTYDLVELGRYFRHYQQLMAHWRRALPSGRMLEVRYEELVGDLEGVARRLVAHCGLAWDARCLEFHRTERPVRTASATQVRRPIYQSSIARWRKYEKFLAPLLDELHYAYVPAPTGGAQNASN